MPRVISMTQFRCQPGEWLLDVRRERMTFLLTRQGKPVAKLGPVDETTVIESDGRIRGELPVTFRWQDSASY